MNAARLRSWITLILALLILPISLWGFGSKLIEFISVYRERTDGAFAVAPILNYMLASAGFFLLLLWAAMNGMFHDIEGPKHTLLEREAELDAQQARHNGSSRPPTD